MKTKERDRKFLAWMHRLDPGCDMTEETLKLYRSPEYRKKKKVKVQPKKKKMHRVSESRSSPDGIDWQKVAREENAYLRKERGLTPSAKIVRGGKCSPR